MPPAGFWPRLKAFLMDGVILLPIGMAELQFAYQFDRPLHQVLFQASLGIIGWAYDLYFHASFGQTPGKMWQRIKVVRLDGSDIGFKRALLRRSVNLML